MSNSGIERELPAMAGSHRDKEKRPATYAGPEKPSGVGMVWREKINALGEEPFGGRCAVARGMRLV